MSPIFHGLCGPGHCQGLCAGSGQIFPVVNPDFGAVSGYGFWPAFTHTAIYRLSSSSLSSPLFTIFSTICSFALAALPYIVQACVTVLHLFYQDILCLLAAVLHVILYVWWFIANFIQWLQSLLLPGYNTLAQSIFACCTWLQAAINYIYSMLSALFWGVFNTFSATLADALGFIWTIIQVLWAIVVPVAKAVFFVITNIHLIMLFVFKLAVASVVIGIACHIRVIIYRFFNQCDFALQGDFYFGPNPQNPTGCAIHCTSHHLPTGTG